MYSTRARLPKATRCDRGGGTYSGKVSAEEPRLWGDTYLGMYAS